MAMYDNTNSRITKYRNDYSRCNIQIDIYKEQDYKSFFEKYVNGKTLKPEFAYVLFCFRIYPSRSNQEQFADEQLLFFYFLIANCYGKDHFVLEVYLDQFFTENSEVIVKKGDYYRFLNFSLFQARIEGLRSKIFINNEVRILEFKGYMRDKLPIDIGKIFPALTINCETYKILQTPINEALWDKIQNENSLQSDSQLLDMLIQLCRRYLFICPEESKVYRNIRGNTFRLPDFYKLIEGIPIFTLVLFSEVDFYSRRDMLAELRKRISGKITLKELLDDYQEEQTYEKYLAHVALMKEGINNKSLLLRRNDAGDEKYDDICKAIDGIIDLGEKRKLTEKLHQNYGLHPQVVAEMYEAISISEGLFQLMDNIVMHAGCGILSIRMHDVSGNTPLKSRYPVYFSRYNSLMEGDTRKRLINTQYFLEVRIGDISGTNVSDKFRENNQEFGNSLQGSDRTVYEEFELSAFFNPSENEKTIWDKFYSHSRNIVNHYGLQIFDSILNSKEGYFQVVSGHQQYQNILVKETITRSETLKYPGTTYTILLPMHNRVSEDKNIYDSMLLYRTNESLIQLNKVSCCVCNFGKMMRPEAEKRAAFYESVHQKISKEVNNDNLIVIDMDTVCYLEGIVKGVLLYLFSEECQSQKESIYIAFINCKTYQIIEIVRLISLSYDKMGRNSRMEKVQIFIRGKEIGEEILFYGNTLSDVGKNIMKLACMRGILYDNYQTVDVLLNRR